MHQARWQASRSNSSTLASTSSSRSLGAIHSLLSVEVAIIAFGPVRVQQDFVTADMFAAPHQATEGGTPIAPPSEQRHLPVRRIADPKHLNIEF